MKALSVLEKAGYIPNIQDVDVSKLNDEDSKNIITTLYNFNQTLNNVTEKEEPSILARYLVTLEINKRYFEIKNLNKNNKMIRK